jgi:hypothetical protein
MFQNSFPKSVMGYNPNPQDPVNRKISDENTRKITISSSSTKIDIDTYNDSSFIAYISPAGSGAPIEFNSISNLDENSLHVLVVDNSNNSLLSKSVTFSNNYVFLDNLGTNVYSVAATKKLVFYGAVKNGKLNLRVSYNSTN